MRLVRMAVPLMIASLAVGCGGATPRASGPDPKAVALASYHKCQRSLAGFTEKLTDLNSRLDVGLTQAEYNTALGDAKVEYDKIDAQSLGPTCLSVGTELETAYNAYAKADAYWAHCINSTYCTVDKTRLQDDWSIATGTISAAQTLLDGIRTQLPTAR